MDTYIDNFMLGPITGTNRNFASKYIINTELVNKISCCLEYNNLESVLSARAITNSLLHTDQTQCIGEDWGGSLQKANVL